jgi:CHAT domain-containing protein
MGGGIRAFQHSLLLVTAALALAFASPGRAQPDPKLLEGELIGASRSIWEGRVDAGIKRLVDLVQRIDPSTDRVAYWRASANLIDFLHQTEQYEFESKVIDTLIRTKIWENDFAYTHFLQFFLGRNLFRLGKIDEAEKVLRVLTSGDRRDIFTTQQRAAAILISEIEFSRGRISQAAIWMRRAVIGTLVQKGVGSEEIIHVLTQYSFHLVRMQRYPEAYQLFLKMSSIYGSNFPQTAPANIFFLARFLNAMSSAGNFQGADLIYDKLKNQVSEVDVVPASVLSGLFFHDLFRIVRSSSEAERKTVLSKMNDVISKQANFLAQRRNRVLFAFFAALANEAEIAERFLNIGQTYDIGNDKWSAYELLLRSALAASQKRFEESISMGREVLQRVHVLQKELESEAASWLPALSWEDRLILGHILAANASQALTPEQSDVLFQIAQFLNRDRVKLGLSRKFDRGIVESDLKREDIRTRDRLKDLRERAVDDAVSQLLSRILPIRGPVLEQDNDFGPLTRLEEFEDKVSRVDTNLRRNSADSAQRETPNSGVSINTITRFIRQNEALIVHVPIGDVGLFVACVNSDREYVHLERLDQSAIQQTLLDERLLSAAVRTSHPPSPTLDASFPTESSYRLFSVLLGGVEPCLRNRSHILLATDPDLFAIPWNALLTEPAAKDREFQHRTAAWLPRSFALSLLPSVRSMFQLRAHFSQSRAREKFLGIGDPDFQGAPQSSTQISMRSLVSARGIGDPSAIAELPRLPESADELRTVAEALGVSQRRLLLGRNASERALRKHPLDDYQVLSFATHAVVANEMEGLTEPAIVLSPGEEDTNPRNDGLLTATEVANLTLDANLVILSACNTAAADGHIAGRGLSGLADAFFAAGARAVAVTQWAVFSNVAQHLGAGLITQSVKSIHVGVSEGLRRTMVDYLSSVSEDHLAHPRFWAAFYIAGDGDVRPLGEGTNPSTLVRDIDLEWESIAEEPTDELVSIARVPGQNAFFAHGIEKPSTHKERAGSNTFRMTRDGEPKLWSRSKEISAGSIIAFNDGIARLGYSLSDQRHSAAVFQLFDRHDKLRWEFVQDGPSWDFPISMIKVHDRYVLVSVEKNFSNLSDVPSVVLNVLSRTGSMVATRRYAVPIRPSGGGVPKAAVLVAKNSLLIAIGGHVRSNAPSSQMWINPDTGSKIYCGGEREATLLLSINLQTLEVERQKTIEGMVVNGMQISEGRLYAVVEASNNCRLDKDAALFEVAKNLDLKPVFRSSHVNGLIVKDLEVSSAGFVLVGSVKAFMPTSLTRLIRPTEELGDVWSESLWEKNEDRSSGFIIAIDKNGNVLGDRVFPDTRNRSISKIVASDPDRFVGVGNALGGRGWFFAFRLRHHMKHDPRARHMQPNGVRR